MDDLLSRRIPETAYLDTENTYRYRAILNFFFIQHERLRHFLFPDEILAHLHQKPLFAGYTMDSLQADLKILVEKRNLSPRQDTTRVATIQDFKQKRYRYQATPVSIEIERMVRKISELGRGYGGSLEITLFDSLLERLERLVATRDDQNGHKVYVVFDEPPERIYHIWNEMYDCFRKMGDNASDYLAHLKSEKVEARIQTQAFLVYKDAFGKYLRNFVMQLQRASVKIEALLGQTDPAHIARLTAVLGEYEAGIPRMDETPLDPASQAELYRLRWQALFEWFHGKDGARSEWLSLQEETNDTIRRLTRFAQRIGERLLHAHGRRKDYLHLARWFAGLDTLNAAHRLSSVVFGVDQPRHLAVGRPPADDWEQSLWCQEPERVTITPAVTHFRPRTRAQPVRSQKQAREALLRDHLLCKQRERELIENIIRDGSIRLSQLRVVDPYIRKTLLDWVARCTASQQGVTRAETGHLVSLIMDPERRVQLVSEDGSMDMPDCTFTLITREPASGEKVGLA